MGFFYDMLQSYHIDELNEVFKTQAAKTLSLEQRVEKLEKQLQETRQVLYKTLCFLEQTYQKDIDLDGQIKNYEK
ncbi:MAG: hypothetical protein AB1782_18515 [Cyanobacteriota bacterium]